MQIFDQAIFVKCCRYNMGFAKLVAWRACFFILSGFLLASCATRDPSSLTYGKRDVGIDEAFILPADRSVVGITQERASNAITQTIALSTNAAASGENNFRVTFFGPVNSEGASEHSLSYTALTEGRISRELRTEMAGIAMTRSPYYVQNNYGPFSYATGNSSTGDSCIYAWQQIRAPAHTQNFFQNRGRIDLRLRLCETGASQEKLLATMYEFTINSTIAAGGWNPYGEPASPSPHLGRPGNPLLAPSVNSNLSGPFPASDLNTERLNTSQQAAAIRHVQQSAPNARRMAPAPQRASVVQAPPMQDYYPPVAQPYAVNPYPQAPITAPSTVTVPAPQQVAPAQVRSIVPQVGQPASAATVYQAPQTLQVPSPVSGQGNIIRVPAPAASAFPATGSALVVPSPCKVANNQSSGTPAGNTAVVCP